MELGRITCYGCSHAPDGWAHHNLIGVNRLYFIHGGKGGCRHNGRDYDFKPGNLYFIPHIWDFRLRTDREDPVLHTYMDFELFPPVMTRDLLTASPDAEPLTEAALAVFFAGARKQTEAGKGTEPFLGEEAQSLICKGAVQYLVTRLVESCGVPVLQDPVVLQALERMHRDLSQSVTVEQLARESFMNTDSFIRRFSAAMGITPYAYLKRLRLNTARRLRQEGRSLAQIAQETGYSDASALLHALKKAEREEKQLIR